MGSLTESSGATLKGKMTKELKDVVIPFGRYKGKKLDEIPLLYLDWLMGVMRVDIDKPTRRFKSGLTQKKHGLLYQQIKKYLNNPLIKQAWAVEVGEQD